jgi:hypothetical protein
MKRSVIRLSGVKKRLAVKPDPETHEKYNKGFETYKKLNPLHRKIDYGN